MLGLTCYGQTFQPFGNLLSLYFLQHALQLLFAELFLHAWTLFVPRDLFRCQGHVLGAYPGSACNALHVAMVELLAQAHVATAVVWLEILLMVQKSGYHQLRLVVYPMIFIGLSIGFYSFHIPFLVPGFIGNFIQGFLYFGDVRFPSEETPRTSHHQEICSRREFEPFEG